MTNISTRPYKEQLMDWPASGEHILASYDDDSIVVYQAYRNSIAEFAVRNQRFGGGFSYNRMSWIKPNFLWMMYRSGWATKDGQENILAIELSRVFFDELLANAVASSFEKSSFDSRDSWQEAVKRSDVRLQWDPDHDPAGQSVERRAVQLGLRGNSLRRFGTDEILSIANITEMVAEQRINASGGFEDLIIPAERVYIPESKFDRNIGKSIKSTGPT